MCQDVVSTSPEFLPLHWEHSLNIALDLADNSVRICVRHGHHAARRPDLRAPLGDSLEDECELDVHLRATPHALRYCPNLRSAHAVSLAPCSYCLP